MSQNPWSNREFNTNSYYNQPPPQPVPPPASFTIGGDPYLAPQPVPPPSARSAVFGKPMTSPVIQETRGLPNKLYECQGTIVIYQVRFNRNPFSEVYKHNYACITIENTEFN